MLNIYGRIDEIEKLMGHEKITGYKIEIYTEEKNYVVYKPEQEKINTNAVGFEIPNKNEYEEEE